MDTPLTTDEVLDAIHHLRRAFLDHHPLDDDQWDRAISTLLVAREQYGGRIRHLIHLVLTAGDDKQPTAALSSALDELHCSLALADTPMSEAMIPTEPPALDPPRSIRQEHLHVRHGGRSA